MLDKTLLALAIMMAAQSALAARRPLPPPAIVETRTLPAPVVSTQPVPAPPAAATPPTAPEAAMAALPVTAPAAEVTITAPESAPPTATDSASAAVPTTLPALTPPPGPGNDGIWRKIVLGTWQAVDSPEATVVNGEATLTPDGKAVGYTTATYVYGDGSTSDVKVGTQFRWRIEAGVLIFDQYESDPPGFIKSTQVRRFAIQSMNDTGAVLKDLDDGELVYRRRKLN